MRYWSFFSTLGALLALCCPNMPAANFNLDFESNPESLGVKFFGTAEWRDFNGVDDSGYLSITDALNGQRGAIVFPDLENGNSLTAFHITADLRVGGGTDRPADGFSFNFARPDDPVLDDGEGWASSPTGEGNLPEEGTTTGLAIGFDEWYSGGSDVVGMSVRIDNELVDQFEFPTLNGEVDDTDSLQTGPQAVFDDELQDMMGWAPLDIKLCANNLTVKYKDVEVFNQKVDYDPSPGLLVFGGRTGGANSYHHIDNITIQTGEDVGAGCTVVPPSFVAGEGTIGARTFDSDVSNEVYGPVQPGVPGWSVRLVDVDETVDNQTIADDILDDPSIEGVTKAYDVVNLGGGAGTFPDTQPYPNGVADTSMEDFAVEANADVVIPAGLWTIGFGSDDGGEVTIPGVVFDNFNNNDSFDDDQIRYEGNRGHGWTVGSFELAEPLETTIHGAMHERGGGDSFEIAVTDGEAIEDADPALGWELLGDGTLGWSVTTTAAPLESADLSAAVVTTRPLVFDVNGDTDTSDQLVVENPDPNVYTTILDVDGAIFRIAGTGALADGDTFEIVDADTIVGTPTIESADPAQNWVFNPATGEVTLGGAVVALQPGDANMDLKFDQLDLVKVQVAAKYLTGEAATWGSGDWNGGPGGSVGNPPTGDGLFNQLDIVAAQIADKYLKGPYGALAGEGQGDGNASISYDPSSGEVAVVAGATELTSINIDSAAGIFTGDAAQNLGGSFDNDADNNIFKATFGGSFGSLSFGNVAQAGLSEEFVRDDLSAVGSLLGGGDLGAVDLIYVPEPSTVILLAMGLVGLLALVRRRR